MYRPNGWETINPDPCKDCPDIQLDNYGYLCDLACGKHTAYLNREAGVDAILKVIWKMAKDSPTGIFTFDTNTINIFKEEI